MINIIFSSIQAYLFFYLFLEVSLFLDDSVFENVIDIEVAKVQSQGVAKHLLNF